MNKFGKLQIFVCVSNMIICQSNYQDILQQNHTHYTLKRESLVGTLEAPRGVRQMNGVPQSGADRCTTAESSVRANWSNRFTVTMTMTRKTRQSQSLFFNDKTGVNYS